MTHQITGLINVYQPKQLSKPLVILFSLTQLFLGMNYGFFDILNKNLRVLANLVSVITFVVLSALSWLSLDLFWLNTATNAYYMWVFLVLRFSNYHLHKFLKDMIDIDAKWNLVVKDAYFGLKMLLYNLTWFCIKGSLLYYFFFVIMIIRGWIKIGFLMFHHSALTMFFILSAVNMLVYHQVYLRINVLKSMIEAKKMRINDALIIFQSLANCLAKIRVSQNKIIAVGFIMHFLRGVFEIGNHLQCSISDKEFIIQIITAVDMLQWVLEIVVPAVFAETVAAEVDGLKAVIHERLVTETDKDIEKDLVRLLRYVEARPLLRKAWRIVPVDLQLPVTLLSMSVTYIIVFLQFRHVF